MRADFYGHPANYPQLGTLIYARNETILPMTIAELRDAIEKPARLSGLQFDPELPADIIFALRERDQALAGALPLLQFTLERLYAGRVGNLLTRDAYSNMGGVQGAIGQHSEDVFTALPENVQAALGRVFLRLINIDETTGEATRRRAMLEHLDPNTAALVNALVKNRLLQTGDEGGQPYLEIAHEALFSSWGRLAEWIEETKDDLRLLRQVEIAAREWNTNHRRTDYIWSQKRLEPVYAMHERLRVSFDSVMEAFVYSEIDHLLDEFKSERASGNRQMAIIDQLVKIGHHAVPALIEMRFLVAGRRRDPIRAHCLSTLGQLSESAAPILIEHLGRESAKIRRAAAEALGKVNDPRAIEPLINTLNDPDKDVRLTAAEALGEMNDSRAVEPLINALNDPDSYMRRTAAEALGEINDPRAVEPLINALNDPDSYMRRTAAEALGEINDPRAVEPLINALNEADFDMRYIIVNVLSKIADVEAAELLIKVLNSSDMWVRRTAANILKKIGTPEALAAVAAWRKSHEDNEE